MFLAWLLIAFDAALRVILGVFQVTIPIEIIPINRVHNVNTYS